MDNDGSDDDDYEDDDNDGDGEDDNDDRIPCYLSWVHIALYTTFSYSTQHVFVVFLYTCLLS